MTDVATDHELRVLVLDKAPAYRYRLEAVLAGADGVDVVHSTRSETGALEEARRLLPQVAIVDPAGLADPPVLLAALRRAAPGVRIVLHSGLPVSVMDALRPHADVVLAKGVDGRELIGCLHSL